jgi:alpha-beta hydrolase superfamily lysophospholipase
VARDGTFAVVANEGDVQAKKPAKRKIPLGGKIGLGIGFVLMAGGLTLGVTASIPTDVDRLSVEFPAIEDRTGRLAGGSGCALSEVGTPGACRKAVVTGVRDEEVTFPSRIPEKGLARLKGTLSLPLGVEGRRPAVILIHGSGPNGRDEPLDGDLVSRLSHTVKVFAELADFFVHEGLVVLRYDKRVPRFYPDMDRTKSHAYRWSDIEADGRDALEFLATRPEVDPDALVVAGHSEGGQIAPYVAHDNPRVAAVIMLAGTMEGFEVGLEGQLERLARAREAQWDPIGAWSVRQQGAKYQECFDKLRTHYVPEEVCIGGGVTQAALKDYDAYVARMAGILASDRSPVLAIQGSVDRNIAPDMIPRLGTAMGPRDHELHYVPGVSHDLVNVVTPTKPPSVDAELKKRLSTFLASVRPR